MNRLHVIRLLSIATVLLSASAAMADGPFSFYSLTPCRVLDTRDTGIPLQSDAERTLAVRGRCGVPADAKAVWANVTVIQPSAGSWLTLWPAGTSRPYASFMNFTAADLALANGGVLALSTTTSPDLAVYNNLGTVHLIIDVGGYFR